MPHEEEIEIHSPSINDIHDEMLIKHFEAGLGKKVFILTSSFPFVFIGKIKEIIDDFAVVDVETTSISELEKRKWHIHIHDIEVFYIERSDGPPIPNLTDNM